MVLWEESAEMNSALSRWEICKDGQQIIERIRVRK